MLSQSKSQNHVRPGSFQGQDLRITRADRHRAMIGEYFTLIEKLNCIPKVNRVNSSINFETYKTDLMNMEL